MVDATTTDAPPSVRRVHVIGAGPVGLLMTAMLQSMEGFFIRLYEKRPSYTRTRMVKLASYLTADSISAYCADEVDGDNVGAIFEPGELERGLAFRRSIEPRIFGLLQGWNRGFCRLKDIEESLTALIDEGGKSPVERIQEAITAEQAIAMLQPHEIMIDCTGANSLLRDHLVPPTANESDPRERNTYKIRLEYAANVTFLWARPYLCNEYCKYYKNRDNGQYKFVPAVDRIAQDADTTHVFGIISISAEDFEAMPSRCNGDHLREHFPAVAASMDRFIEQIRLETQGELLSEIDVVRIPLNLYHARNFTATVASGVLGRERGRVEPSLFQSRGVPRR